MTAPPLLDLHDLGLRQTGNESWARSLSAALLEHGGPGSYDIAVTSAVDAADLRRLPARRTVQMSRNSARRLAVDLPLAMRRLGTTALLVQYTTPLSPVGAVVAVHDLSFEDARAAEWLPLPTRLRYRATVRASVRRAAHVIVDSPYTRDDLLGRYAVQPERVTVAELAVDPDFDELLRLTPEDRTGRPTVLVVGNVLPRKNVLVVARAVKLLRDRGQDVVMRLVGSVRPTGRADAERAQQLLGAQALTVTGYVSAKTLARELRTAHVLAFPSLFEGFGIPVLEAMAAGLPVVVSDRTSLPGLVADAGVVVPAEDPGAWADALGRALDGSDATRLRAAGSARVRQFGWDRSAAIVADVLAAVV